MPSIRLVSGSTTNSLLTPGTESLSTIDLQHDRLLHVSMTVALLPKQHDMKTNTSI